MTLPICDGVRGRRPCGGSPAIRALAPREPENTGSHRHNASRLGSGRAGRSAFVETAIGPQQSILSVQL